ncbi:MAG: hypothetical protein LBB88_01985 [Planctomycetaceae bacterium]|jgi:hypothetical protein|nr:hypothetical protein [Planctomycetaceae bacterium]
MSNIGKIAVNKSGSQIVLANGRVAAFNQNGVCADCCKPRIIASYVMNNSLPWDLRQYQGDNIAPPDSRWRIIEVGYNNTSRTGVVDENGKLVGLPAQFTPGYSYSTYRLEIGCPQTNGVVRWS